MIRTGVRRRRLVRDRDRDRRAAVAVVGIQAVLGDLIVELRRAEESRPGRVQHVRALHDCGAIGRRADQHDARHGRIRIRVVREHRDEDRLAASCGRSIGDRRRLRILRVDASLVGWRGECRLAEVRIGIECEHAGGARRGCVDAVCDRVREGEARVETCRTRDRDAVEAHDDRVVRQIRGGAHQLYRARAARREIVRDDVERIGGYAATRSREFLARRRRCPGILCRGRYDEHSRCVQRSPRSRDVLAIRHFASPGSNADSFGAGEYTSYAGVE